MRLDTVYRIETLVMSDSRGFSPAVSASLFRWIEAEAEALESHWPSLGIQDARTKDALQRLERCRISLAPQGQPAKIEKGGSGGSGTF